MISKNLKILSLQPQIPKIFSITISNNFFLHQVKNFGDKTLISEVASQFYNFSMSEKILEEIYYIYEIYKDYKMILINTVQSHNPVYFLYILQKNSELGK